MLRSMLLIAQLIMGFKKPIDVAQAVVVERNFFSYYKLPVKAGKPAAPHNTTQEFLILQCPHRASTDIPKPQNMQLCAVVALHRERERATNLPQMNKLHTTVMYRTIRPGGREMIVVPKLKPIVMAESTIPMRCKSVWQNRKLTLRSMKGEKMGSTKPSIWTPPRHQRMANVLMNNSESGDFNSTLQIDSTRNQTKGEYDEQHTEDFPDFYVDLDEPKSVLKYLTFKHPGEDKNAKKMEETKESEKFFAEERQYRSGEKIKGYQNMYHRDEIYKDHIFYDDVQQQGNYRNYMKKHDIF